MKHLIFNVIWATFLSWTLALSGQGATPAAEPNGTPDFAYVGFEDYRSKDPGRGIAYRFKGITGEIDEHHYSAGRKNWPEGVADMDINRHFKSNVAEIFKARDAEGWKAVDQLGLRTEDIAGKRVLHAWFRITNKEGKQIQRHLYLTALNGELVKFRASLWEPVTQRTVEDMEDFVKLRVGECAAAGKPVAP